MFPNQCLINIDEILLTKKHFNRLRDWLETKISDPLYPGLEWLNKQQKIFRIPWKHGGRHGWKEEEDARLFREWSEHTGEAANITSMYVVGCRYILEIFAVRSDNQMQDDIRHCWFEDALVIKEPFFRVFFL